MHPQRPLWLIALLLQVPPGAPAAENPTVATEGSHLLLDSRWVAMAQNARLVLGTVQKHPGNPLMAEDHPWEARFDNLYANVIHDPADNLYKCWYSPFIVDLPAKGLTPAQRKTIRYRPPAGREMGVCYAVSHDGLLWEKPGLHLVDFEGTGDNNLVVRGPHGAGILLDPADPDPERRYKMFRAEDMRYSSDGLQWTAPQTSTGILSRSDTHNNLLRVPESGRYVGFVRLWSDGWGRGQRIVGRTESADLQQWSRAVEVLRGDALHQTYAMPVFRYAGVYLGLVAVFRTEEDRVHTELAWSPDTVSWNRIQPGTPFLGNSATEGDYDWGCVYAAASPVVLEDGIRIYYGGSNGPHTSWRDGFLCLSTLRPDGWAGYEPQDPSAPALITTRPVECSGDNLWITSDVTDGGKILVTTLDEAGHPLDRVTITQTGTRAIAGRLLAFRNRPVKVNLEVTKAKVYSFGFADDP